MHRAIYDNYLYFSILGHLDIPIPSTVLLHLRRFDSSAKPPCGMRSAVVRAAATLVCRDAGKFLKRRWNPICHFPTRGACLHVLRTQEWPSASNSAKIWIWLLYTPACREEALHHRENDSHPRLWQASEPVHGLIDFRACVCTS